MTAQQFIPTWSIDILYALAVLAGFLGIQSIKRRRLAREQAEISDFASIDLSTLRPEAIGLLIGGPYRADDVHVARRFLEGDLSIHRGKLVLSRTLHLESPVEMTWPYSLWPMRLDESELYHFRIVRKPPLIVVVPFAMATVSIFPLYFSMALYHGPLSRPALYLLPLVLITYTEAIRDLRNSLTLAGLIIVDRLHNSELADQPGINGLLYEIALHRGKGRIITSQRDLNLALDLNATLRKKSDH